MDKIKISQMTMEDLEGVYEIDKEAFPIPWRRSSFEEELKNVLATYLVAKIDGIRKNYYKNPDNTHEDAILMTKEF